MNPVSLKLVPYKFALVLSCLVLQGDQVDCCDGFSF